MGNLHVLNEEALPYTWKGFFEFDYSGIVNPPVKGGK
jgi:hypothetical protein